MNDDIFNDFALSHREVDQSPIAVSGIQPPADLTPMQLRWVEARMTARSDAEAARIAGVAPQTVCSWKQKSPSLENYLKELSLERVNSVQTELEMFSHVAMRKMLQLVDSPDDRIAFQAASSILDRSIGKPIARSESKVTVEGFTVDYLGSDGEIIDITPPADTEGEDDSGNPLPVLLGGGTDD